MLTAPGPVRSFKSDAIVDGSEVHQSTLQLPMHINSGVRQLPVTLQVATEE